MASNTKPLTPEENAFLNALNAAQHGNLRRHKQISTIAHAILEKEEEPCCDKVLRYSVLTCFCSSVLVLGIAVANLLKG